MSHSRRLLLALIVFASACGPATRQARRGEHPRSISPEQRAQLDARCLREHVAAKTALRAGERGAAAGAAKRLMAAYLGLAARIGESRARSEACGKTAAETVGQVAQRLHAQGKADEDALDILSGWVAAFARAPRDIPAVLVLAKTFEGRQRWADAARTYTRLLALDRRGEHGRAAAQAAVAMWSRARVKKGASRRPGRGLGADDHHYLRAIDQLLAVDAKTKLRAELLFRKAQVFYGARQPQKALPLCESIVTLHVHSSVAPHAALMLLEILSRKRAEQQLMSWVDRLSKRRRFTRGELGKALQTLRLHAMRRTAQGHADAGRYRPCAARYLALARAGGEKRPDLALFNAAACQQSGGDLPAAIATRRSLATRFPNSRLAPEALLQNGKALLTLGKAAAASRCFERFARRYAQSPGAPGALVQAINARLKAGQKRQARALLERMERQYAKRFPNIVTEARKVIERAGAARGLDATVTPR